MLERRRHRQSDRRPVDGNKYNGEPISAIVFLVPGTNNANLPYDFTVNSFALGTSSADAPDGGVVGHLSGTIGGTGTDADFQRVKVTGGTPTKSYIIQSNNWGNPSGTDQTITYMDNSFTITKATGNGSSAPASFPSIYIGANGNVMSGAYSTIGDDNLPKQISAIQSVQTKMTVNRASGDMNVTYDVWFNSAAPNLSSYRTPATPSTRTACPASSWCGSTSHRTTSRSAARCDGEHRREGLQRLGRSARQRRQPERARRLLRRADAVHHLELRPEAVHRGRGVELDLVELVPDRRLRRRGDLDRGRLDGLLGLGIHRHRSVAPEGASRSLPSRGGIG